MSEEELRNQKQQQAEQALAEHNYVAAVPLLAELYEQHQTSRQNYLYVEALAGAGQYETALAVAQENINSYLAENDRLIRYIHVAVFAGQGLIVTELLESIRSYMTEMESQTIFAALQAETEAYQTQKQEQLEQVKKKLQYLGLEQPLKQRAIAKQSRQLSKSDFLKAVQVALVDENVHPLVRAAFLNDLRLLQVGQAINYLTFEHQQIQVMPNQLLALEETQAYHAFEKMVAVKFERRVDLAQKVLDEITLKLMLLYPIYDGIDSKLEQWYAIFLNDKVLLDQSETNKKLAEQLETSISEWEPGKKELKK